MAELSDLIFTPPTMEQAEEGLFEFYDGLAAGGVNAAHLANDVTGILQYAASVALPDIHAAKTLAHTATKLEDFKTQFAALVKPHREARRSSGKSAGKIPWAQIFQLVIQYLPMILPLFLDPAPAPKPA